MMGYAGCDSLKIIAAFVRVRTISAIRISSKSQFCMYRCVYPTLLWLCPPNLKERTLPLIHLLQQSTSLNDNFHIDKRSCKFILAFIISGEFTIEKQNLPIFCQKSTGHYRSIESYVELESWEMNGSETYCGRWNPGKIKH
jgi:hypothetical protein